MTGPRNEKTKTPNRLAFGALAAVLAAVALACGGASSYEISIETPIQPKLDVSPFQRVLIAGFVAGGGQEDVDGNLETVRLLRSQLRTKSSLKVIDADVMPLIEIAQEQSKTAGEEPSGAAKDAAPAADARSNTTEHAADPTVLPKTIKEEKDLAPYERLFANTAYWKKIGEEYQNPLIVTGTVLFAVKQSNGVVQRDREVFDSVGRRSVIQDRAYMERKGFQLDLKFVFIDGRSGTTLYSEKYGEGILYSAQQNTPPLSSYFELMDRLVPSFLSALSNQKIKGTRVLLN
jgi:hypothetical protein